MTSSLSIPDREAAAQFLNQFGSDARRRGKNHYHGGSVRRLFCDKEGACYTAEVEVGELYVTSFVYEGGAWDAVCSCSARLKCKHAYAGMLALLGGGSWPSRGIGPRVHQPSPTLKARWKNGCLQFSDDR